MPKKKTLKKAERVERLFDSLKIYDKYRLKGGCVVGIDPGRVSPGISIIDGEEHASFGYRTRTSGFSKVMEVEMFVKRTLRGRRIMWAMMEDYAYQSEWNREAMGEMGGIILRYFWRRRIPVLMVAPVQIKNFVGAKAKEHIMKEVYKQWGIDTDNSDAADAVVLAKIGRAVYNMVKWYSMVRADGIELSDKMQNEFETNPGKHIGIESRQSQSIIVNRILISRGGSANVFAQGRKEVEEKLGAKAKEGRKGTSNKKGTGGKSPSKKRLGSTALQLSNQWLPSRSFKPTQTCCWRPLRPARSLFISFGYGMGP